MQCTPDVISILDLPSGTELGGTTWLTSGGMCPSMVRAETL